MVFRKQRCEAILYPLLLTIVFIILLGRSRYGFIWSDEPYYFSEAFRFLKGDAPIADDWYTTQLYSVLLIPFMWLYRLFISPYFMGLFLAFRVGYISLQFMVSLWIYRTFSVKSRQGAFFAALFFLLFCRGNIATLSYYAVETMCLVISQVWIWNRLTVTRASAFRAGCIGLLWGITIICNPYLLILLLTEFLYLSMGERGRLFSRSEKIGLFLGYPPEDVIGFIENDAKNYKYCGMWKVYGNISKAKETFATFKKCTGNFENRHRNGVSIRELTVAG